MRLDKYLGRVASGTLVKGIIYKHTAKGKRPRLNALVVRRRIGRKRHTCYLFTSLDQADAAVKEVDKRLGESGRNKLSVQNRLRRALFLLPNELEHAMSNTRCI